MTNNNDNQFEKNLERIGSAHQAPATPSADLLSACDDIFDREAEKTVAMTTNLPQQAVNQRWRHPAAWSTIGIAASIALIAGVFFAPTAGRKVQAAVVMKQLNQQLTRNELVVLTIDSLEVEEASVDAELQLSDHTIAGRVKVVIDEPSNPMGLIAIDANLAMSPQGSWIYLREFTTTNPGIALLASQYLDDGRDVLIELPADTFEGESILNSEDGNIAELAFGHLQALLSAASDEDPNLFEITELTDGAFMLTIDLDDPDTQASLKTLLIDAFSDGEEADEVADSTTGNDAKNASPDGPKPLKTRFKFDFSAEPDDETAEPIERSINTTMVKDVKEVDSDEESGGSVDFSFDADLAFDDGDQDVLQGVTLQVIYDPTSERVTEFSVLGVGKTDGMVSAQLFDDTVDPTLLDSTTFTTLDTKIVGDLFDDEDDSSETDNN